MKKPSTLQAKFAEFYFRKNSLKRNIWFALKAQPYSPQAQDLCEALFLRPLRAGRYDHFRKVADALKGIDRNSDRPPGAEKNEDEIEHYVFSAARYWLHHPPKLESKWT